MTVKFSMGAIAATPGAMRALEAAGDNPAAYLARHQAGDWGDVDAYDQRANDTAARRGSRILSAYHLSDGVKIWIITEADRSATTILLPEEY